MHLTLSSEDSARWEEGGWSAFRVEETVVEWAIQQDVQEPIIVHADDGSIAFAVSTGEGSL
jgi:hypothetical protein